MRRKEAADTDGNKNIFIPSPRYSTLFQVQQSILKEHVRPTIPAISGGSGDGVNKWRSR